MARVPTYGGQQVLPEALPAARVSSQGAADMQRGAQALAGGMNAAAKTAAQWALEEQEKVNDAAIMAYKNALSGIESDLLNHPETGAYAQKGQNAFGVRERTLPEWDRRQGEALAALPRHLQAQAKALADDKRIQIDNGLMRHTLAESTRYRDEQAAAMVENAGQAALLHWEDETRVGEELGNIDAAISMRMRGAPAEAIAAEKAKAKSAVMSGVFNRHLLRDPLAANEWLDKRRDLFTGEDMMKAEAALQPYFLERSVTDEVKAWMAESQTGVADDATASLPVQGAAQTLEEVRQVAKQSLARTIRLESGGDPNARNPKSTATGLGQFIESTWLNVIARNRPDLTRGKTREQILALRTDPVISREMTEAYATENAIGLFNSGLPVTEQTVYWAHHFGLAGARRILSAPANTPMQQLLDAGSYAANPYLHGKTVGQVLANHQRRAGEHATAQPLPTRPANAAPDWVALKRRADELPNPLRRRAALSEIGRLQSRYEEEKTQRERALNESIYRKVYALEPGQSLLQHLTAEERDYAIREGRLDGFESEYERRWKQPDYKTPPETAFAIDAKLHAAAMGDETALRWLRGLDPYAPENAFMDEQVRNRVASAQLKLTRGSAEEQREARSKWATQEQILNLAYADLGITDSKKKLELQEAYFNEKRAFMASNGNREPDADEMQTIVNRLKLPMARERFFGILSDEERPQYQISEEDAKEYQVPEKARQEILKAYRDAGVPSPTENMIRKAYFENAGDAL